MTNRPVRYGCTRQIKRITAVPAARRSPRATGVRWALPVEEIEQLWECDAGTITTGMGLDFDGLAELLTDRDHENDYCPHQGRGGDPFACDDACPAAHPITAYRLGPEQPVHEAGMAYEMQLERNEAARGIWARLRPLLVQRRAEVLADPARFLDASDPVRATVAYQVLQDADIDIAPGLYCGADLAEQVLANLDAPGVRDALLDAMLYGDGEYWSFQMHNARDRSLPSSDFERALAEAVDKGPDLQLVPAHWMQYLVFPRLRPDERGADVLAGNYVATGTSYHSFLTMDESPAGLLGWREIVMQPCDEHGEINQVNG